jgi:hypothetical protein
MPGEIGVTRSMAAAVNVIECCRKESMAHHPASDRREASSPAACMSRLRSFGAAKL